MKKIFLLNLIFLLTAMPIFSQEYAIDKNSTIVSLTGSLANAGGNLFEGAENKRAITINTSSAANIFLLKNFFVGGSIDYTYLDLGDERQSSASIGPNVGYALGGAESRMYPYLTAGIRYKVSDNDLSDLSSLKGYDVVLGAGVILPIKKHLGIDVELNYKLDYLKQESVDSFTSGDILKVGVGFSGLIF